MANEMQKTTPFGMRDKVGYMFGDFANDFTFILSSSFLMKFYTDVMGVSAGVVGMIMMIARFVDAFTDVTMGQIVDRSKPTKDGKFRPLAQADVRPCGHRILPHLPVRSGRDVLRLQGGMALCDLYPVGLYLLHLRQHPLRLHGFRHLC